MVLFNHATREMTAKIVYYGPGLCGKTTNLMVIFDKLDPKQKGKMLSLATKTDRTLFFDLLPVDIGKVGAFNLKIQLYTVPGQVFYNETRKLVLKGADAVVFVADSQPSMVESTRESFENLIENMEQNNIDPNDTPIVIQFNKRDIPGVLPVETLQEKLGFEGYPYTEAAAVKGEGVMETFRLVSKITAKHLYARLQGKPAAEKAKASPSTRAAARPEPPPDAVELQAVDGAAPVDANPFPESVPFPQSELDSSYDGMEEVSLEQLLSEGRERPATMSGDVALPVDLSSVEEVDDVEELQPRDMVAHDSAPLDQPRQSDRTPAAAPLGAAGTVAEPAPDDDRQATLEQQVQSLESQLDFERAERRAEMQEILRDLETLTARLRTRVDG